MLFWFGIIAAVSLLLTPSIWQQKGKDKLKIYVWQGVKLLIAAVLAYLIGYLGLKDHTVSAVQSTIPIWYVVILVIDFIVVMSTDKKEEPRFLTSFGILGGIALLMFVVMNLIYPMTIKQDLYNIVNAEVKTDKLEATDITHIPSVPMESAHYKAEKLIGQLDNSSYYQLGELTRQKIDGEEYWVAPIEYRGFFESQKANGIPGYVQVSAERKDDIGKLADQYKMKVVPSGYFGNYLNRSVRNHFPSDLIIGIGFEPDDQGKPYYVVAVGHYDKFRSGTVADGAVIVDPQTGEMKKYDMKDVPAYVDFVIPPNMASAYNEWQAKYKHGFWNTIFGKQDLSDVTQWSTGEEVIGVFGPDSRMYWFTDHSSPGTNSLKGYTLMDGRTGKFVFYKGSNGFANGRAALDAVHNSFKKEAWTGTNPVLYNIYGMDTWYIPVVDANGLLRNIALVNAQNPQIVATGESKQDALTSYKFLLATESHGDNSSPTNVSDLKEQVGKVLRVGSVQIGGTTVIQVLLDNSDKVFNINPKDSMYATFIREGDTLRISYVDTNETVVSSDKTFNETLKR